MRDSTSVSELRRAARRHAESLGWSEADAGVAALVATELGSNLVKHAQRSAVSVDSHSDASGTALTCIAVDQGPGIRDLKKSLVDGYSTAGSPGTGLGAIQRLTQVFDMATSPQGTVIVAEVRRPVTQPQRAGFLAGGMAAARDGEEHNGDGWSYCVDEDGVTVFVCDGLGHGPFASAAAERALVAFSAAWQRGPKAALRHLDESLRATRGAAGAIARIEPANSRVRFCGIGNIAAAVVGEERMRHLVSQNGILGHVSAKTQEFEYEWSPRSMLVLHSDGVSGRWRPEHWHGLEERHPGIVAGTLFRDFARGTDDAVVVAVRQA